MNAKFINRILQSRSARWPFQRHITIWLSTVTLLLLGFLLPAHGQDPNPNRFHPSNAIVSLGATVKFQLGVSSTNHPLTFQWQHDGANLPDATNYALWITNATLAHAGGYRAMITNASGDFTNTRTATLTVDPTFIKITTGAIVTDREHSLRASWCDYDGDGFQDLFVANCIVDGSATKNSLYHNNRDGTFTKITTNALSATAGWWDTGAWADVDNDGDPDLYVGGTGSGRQSVFYRNEGNGRFTAVSIGPTRDAAGHDSYFVSWGDYDNDGWVDLFIPTASLPSHRLFRNLGDLNFKSTTAAEVGDVITPSPKGSSALANWLDYDNDNDLDIYIHNWGGYTNALCLNSGNGFFTRTFVGSIATNVYDLNWDDIFPFWGDYDNDGYLDVFVKRSGFAGTLHHNLGGTNSVVVTQSGLEIPSDSMAVTWGDYDNDGNLDLFIANNPSWPYKSVRGANLLFRNNGDGTFSAVDVGSPIWEGRNKWDPYWIDYDNDGLLDLFIAAGYNAPEVNYLYRNNLRAVGNTNHWLKVSLVGKASNASGIGAKVRVTSNIRGKSVTQLRTIDSPGYFGSNQGLLAHFGLGDATVVDLIRIEWPSGNVQEIANSGVDYLLKLTEPIRINPVRPTASLGASVTLTNVSVGTSYQWLHNGTNLVGQTSKTLTLSNLETVDAGRYGVVVTLSDGRVLTNYTYLNIDTQFTKITTGPIVEDKANSYGLHWGDYDNDNNIDLLATNDRGGGSRTANFLYRNQGDGTFARVTNSLFEGDLGAYGGGAWGDINNDGWLDCYVPDAIRWYSTNATANHLLYLGGPGGNFTKTSASLTGSGMRVAWDTAWGDFDNDGLLDLFAVGAWSSLGTRNCLFYNQGDLAFEHVTEGRIVKDPAESEMVAASDYDDDGDLDLLVSSHSQRLLYQNNGDGTFTRITTGPIPQDSGNSAGLAWGDYDNDGKMDLCLATFDERLHLFHNDGAGKFTRSLLGPSSNYQIPNWADYDNDGWLDLFVTHGNGSGEPRNRLYRNNGNGTFTEVKIGSLPTEGGVSFSCAWADYDNNGFLDLVVANGYQLNGRNFLYRNNGNNNHWLKVKLVGTTSNRSAIGAKVRAQASIYGKQIRQMREITGSGSRSQNDPRAHFGLGNTTNVTTLRIEWPSGTVQELKNIAADQMLTIIEPRRPIMSGVLRADGSYEVAFTTELDRSYELQASDDLETWVTVATSTGTGEVVKLLYQAPLAVQRFYRVISP